MNHWLWSALLAGWVLAHPAAASADGLTLEEAIRAALADNPSLQATRRGIAAHTGRAVQARLWPNPELELSAEDVPIESGGFSDAQDMIGIVQTVPFPGKKSLDANISRQAVTASEWEYVGREIELLRDVKMAFIAVLVAEQKVAVSEQLLELARSLAGVAGKRVAAGAATDQERLRADIELDRARIASTAARRELDEAKKTLATLMGRAEQPIGPLRGELRERVDPLVLEQARAQMLARHPRIQAAAARRQQAELELRRARLEPYPDVTFGVAGGRDFGQEETVVALHVSVPLPLLDRARGSQRAARAEAEVARFDQAAAEQQLLRELGVVEARLRASSEQADAYRTRVLPRTEQALRLVRSGFEAGKFGFLDLVDTQRTLAESRLAYYDTLSDLNAAQAALEALLLKDLRSPLPDEQRRVDSQPQE